MILSQRKRGEPLLVMALVLAGWVGARAYAWRETSGQTSARIAGPKPAPAIMAGGSKSFVQPKPEAAPRSKPSAARMHVPAYALSLVPKPQVAAPKSSPRKSESSAGAPFALLAATALLPLPSAGLGSGGVSAAARSAPRWSADGWVLVRRGGAGQIAPGALAGTYGASQAGAVLRYRLHPDDTRRASVYFRATGALDGVRQQEAAVGLAARIRARLPVVAMAEVRTLRDAAGTGLRPAAALVTELPAQALPLGVSAEIYVQGGYVGGHYPTGFIDGLARVERPVTSVADTDLRAGAGAWAAKQRGASRVDLGPVASVSFPLAGHAFARLEADWRFRVAGRAQPGSGPALTLSTGF